MDFGRNFITGPFAFSVMSLSSVDSLSSVEEPSGELSSEEPDFLSSLSESSASMDSLSVIEERFSELSSDSE